MTAGLVVAAGIASVMVGRLGALRAFGPGLALTVLIAMVVAATLAPALIAIFGSLLFRPGPARLRRAIAARKRGAIDDRTKPARGERMLRAVRGAGDRLATARPVALLLIAACVAGLLLGAGGCGRSASASR